MIDRNLLGQLMAEFESERLPDNPFSLDEAFNADVLNQVSAFASENVVPKTSWWMSRLGMRSGFSKDAAAAYVIAGFLQGLVIGWEYNQRTGEN